MSRSASAHGSASIAGFRARVVDDQEALASVRSAWDGLAVQSSRPYCAPSWMLAWWRHAAPVGSQLRVVVVTGPGGEPAGIAPFFIDRGPLGVVRYRVLGAGTSSSVDLLARPGAEGAVAEAVVGALRSAQPAPDVVVFEGIPADSPWPALLEEFWPGRVRLITAASMAAPEVSLEGQGFDDWFASRSGHFRGRMRRGYRKMAERGGLLRTADEGSMRGDLAAFAALHRSRWEHRGGSGVLTDGVVRMLEDVAAELRDAGRLRVRVIEAAGGPVSVQVFLAAGDRLAYWLGGFDESWSDLRPGPAILTVLSEIEHGYEAGVRWLDLGAGEQPYKSEFATGARRLDWMVLALPTIRSPLAHFQLLPLKLRLLAARRLSPGLKRKLRRIRLPIRRR